MARWQSKEGTINLRTHPPWIGTGLLLRGEPTQLVPFSALGSENVTAPVEGDSYQGRSVRDTWYAAQLGIDALGIATHRGENAA